MPALAEAVDDRGAYGKELGNLAHREETCRTVQQECSKTLSKCCQNLLIRPVVCGRMSIVIANTCQRQIPPAIPLSGVHTAGVAGSNPAAPTKNSPQRSRCWRDHFRSLLGGWGPFGPNLDPARAKSRPRRADLRLQVAVNSGRRAHVAVPQQALNAVRVDAGTEKQRCGCVALMPTSA